MPGTSGLGNAVATSETDLANASSFHSFSSDSNLAGSDHTAAINLESVGMSAAEDVSRGGSKNLSPRMQDALTFTSSSMDATMDGKNGEQTNVCKVNPGVLFWLTYLKELVVLSIGDHTIPGYFRRLSPNSCSPRWNLIACPTVLEVEECWVYQQRTQVQLFSPCLLHNILSQVFLLEHHKFCNRKQGWVVHWWMFLLFKHASIYEDENDWKVLFQCMWCSRYHGRYCVGLIYCSWANQTMDMVFHNSLHLWANSHCFSHHLRSRFQCHRYRLTQTGTSSSHSSSSMLSLVKRLPSKIPSWCRQPLHPSCPPPSSHPIKTQLMVY